MFSQPQQDVLNLLRPLIEREQNRISKHNRRATRLGLPGTLTLHQWLYTLHHYQWKCAYCANPYQSLDHVIPIGQGGGTTATNCVPACHECNHKRGQFFSREREIIQALAELERPIC